MAKPDIIYEAHTQHTSYRLKPNPDAPPGSGYKDGAVLEWSDDGGKKWEGYFFIGPEAIEALGYAFAEASKDVT